MADEITLSGFAVGAVTAGLALVAKEIGQYFVKKQLEEHDTAYLAAVDLLTTITAVEHVFERVAKQARPPTHDELLSYSRSWTIRPPSFDIKDLAAVFEDVELCRELMLIGDRHTAFAADSVEHAATYDWLLEHGESDWGVSVTSKDHLERLDSLRQRLTRYSREILQDSYSALSRLLRIAETWMIARRGQMLRDLMGTRYALTSDKVALAARYYKRAATTRRFDPAIEWTIVIAREALTLEFDSAQNGATFPEEVQLSAREELVVPLGIEIKSAHRGAKRVELNLKRIESRTQVELKVVSGEGVERG